MNSRMTCFIRPYPRLDASCFRRKTVDVSHESYFVSQFFQDVSSPSLRQIQLSGHTVPNRRNSSSLTVVFVTMQKGLRLSTAQLHRVCSRCLRTLVKYRAMRFMFIFSLSVGHRIFRAVSFTLDMMSARSCHMCHTFPAAVLCRDTVVGALLTLGVATGLESYRPSTGITSRMHFGLASTKFPRAVLTITLPKKKI